MLARKIQRQHNDTRIACNAMTHDDLTTQLSVSQQRSIEVNIRSLKLNVSEEEFTCRLNYIYLKGVAVLYEETLPGVIQMLSI